MKVWERMHFWSAPRRQVKYQLHEKLLIGVSHGVALALPCLAVICSFGGEEERESMESEKKKI